MRKHLKYLRKEKGLTLVELLAVLVILGIIAAIAVPMIGNLLDNTAVKGEINDALNIIAAAKLAEAEGVGKSTDTSYSRQELIDGGYLDSSVANFTSVDKVTDTKDSKKTIDWKIKGYPFDKYTAGKDKDLSETELKNALKDM